MISTFFIKRPVFASVMSIIIMLAGFAAIKALPVAQYPDILPVEITVATNYLGANAEVVASTVAAPLEQQINGAPGMIYMTSVSSDNGQLAISVIFKVGTDPSQAEIDVNNRIQAALASLPQEVRQYGITVSRKSSSLLAVIVLTADEENYDPLYLSNYASLYLIDPLKRVDGIGDAALFGANNYAMRIWLHPDKMSVYKISTADIANAIRAQNSQFAIGQFGQQPIDDSLSFNYSLTTKGRFSKVEDFEDILIKTDETGSSLKLKDLAKVELGAQDYSFKSYLDGKKSVSIGIYLEPGANALNTIQAVNKVVDELSTRFPPGISYAIPFDTTRFIQVSVKEVIKTFIEATILVILIVYLFLQDSRATIIPLLAVPVSLIGTFAGMYVLGFSINLMTLFGLVLAIGIVVDDAIVVIENVERTMRERNLPAKEATIEAMKEVNGPIIAIVLVLCAVFIPAGFISGLAGIIYKQFAITIAISVIISGIVALTLTPALCAIFIKPRHSQPAIFFQKFNNFFYKITQKYIKGVSYILNSVFISLGTFVFIIIVAIVLFKRLPSGLVPAEDQGYVMNIVNLPPGASLNRTEEVITELSSQFLQDSAIKHVLSLAGLDLLGGGLKTSAGASFLILKDWSERDSNTQNSMSIVQKLFKIGAQVRDAIVFALNPPPIIGMSNTGGFELYLQYYGSDNALEHLQSMTSKLLQESQKRPELAQIQTTLSTQTPQYYLELDRTKAAAFNLNISDIFTTMQASFGVMYVNDFSLYGRTYKTIIQSAENYRRQPEDLAKVFVRSSNNDMVPLSSLFKVERIVGASSINRYNVFPAAKIIGGPKPGYSSGQAIQAIEEVANQVMTSDFAIGFTGTAYQEKLSQSSGSISMVFGIIAVFLILAALYERWVLPIAVIASIPFAIFGALLAVMMRGLSNDIYFQVGLLTLIGLSAKNAILIVEFAVLKIEQGMGVVEATIEAAKLRFRPIVMTSMAFILGCMPLFVSTGAGAASRHSIATGVIGGMLASTFIATFFTPLFFKLITNITKK